MRDGYFVFGRSIERKNIALGNFCPRQDNKKQPTRIRETGAMRWWLTFLGGDHGAPDSGHVEPSGPCRTSKDRPSIAGFNLGSSGVPVLDRRPLRHKARLEGCERRTQVVGDLAA
jgi:hypothetical protein